MLDRNVWMRRFTEGGASAAGIGRDFELKLGTFTDEELKVAGFFGGEALNELYSFDVIFGLGPIEAAGLMGMLGKEVHLRVPFPSGMRHVLGIAAALEIIESRPDSLIARVEIVPRLWRLGQTHNSRVYQNMTTEKIVDEVLTRHQVPHRFKLKHQYPEREYCLQYDESDLAFVQRLLAEEGFVFAFEHWDLVEAKKNGEERATEHMVISDDTVLYSTIQKTPPVLVYQPDANNSMWADEPIVRLVQRNAMGTNMVTLRDYDFERAAPTPGSQHASPQLSTAAPYIQNGSFDIVTRIEAPASPLNLEVFDHRAEEAGERKDNRRSVARLGALAQTTDVFHGKSWTRRLSPGKKFRLHDYTLMEEATELTITRIVHMSHPGGGGAKTEYVNEFEAVRATTLWRPPAPRRRFVQTVESATVVGTAGQDVETDLYGRIKIQFHWDRFGKNDERSSCWVRVSQAWSGATYGFQFVPRIGSEVLVSFLSGDPDHPVVVGSLPNGVNPLPHLLPQNASRSAIRSFSMPVTGGFNEILFDDKAGSELLALRAERDHEVVVLKNQRLDVGENATTSIAGRRSAQVGADDDLDILGSSHRRVGGTATDAVGGALTEVRGGTVSTVIGGSHSVSISGTVETSIGGTSRTVIGSHGPADALTSVNGEYRVAASDFLDLQSGKRIRLKVGTTVVELLPDRLVIQADNIDVVVKELMKAKTKKSELWAKETIDSQGKKIKAVSKGASLVLETDAELDGKNVLLNCKGQKPKPIKDDEPPKKGKVTFQVEPPPGFKGPFTLVIQTPTGQIVEKKTDADNKVQLDGDENEEWTLVEIKKGKVVLQQLGGKGK